MPKVKQADEEVIETAPVEEVEVEEETKPEVKVDETFDPGWPPPPPTV